MRGLLRGTIEYLFPRSPNSRTTSSNIPRDAPAGCQAPKSAFDVLLSSKTRPCPQRSMCTERELEPNIGSSSIAAHVIPSSKSVRSIATIMARQSSSGEAHHDLSYDELADPVKHKRKRRKVSSDPCQVLITRDAQLRTPKHTDASHLVAQVRDPIVDDTCTPGIGITGQARMSTGLTPTGPAALTASHKNILQLMSNGTLQKTGTRHKPRKDVKEIIALCRYASGGNAAAVGDEINRIMSGASRRDHVSEPKAPRKVQGISTPSQSTHPFFVDPLKRRKVAPTTNVTKPEVTSQSPGRKQSAATPGKIRAQIASLRADRINAAAPSPIKRTGTRSKSIGINAPWPDRHLRHIRGPQAIALNQPVKPQVTARKMKQFRMPTISHANVLTHIKNRLEFDQSDRLLDGYTCPVPELRLPSKAFLTGPEILARTQKHATKSKEEKVVRQADPPSKPIHPTLTAIANEIPYGMTPWDLSQSETRPWTTKYAPSSASLVLQDGREPAILAEWLRSLTTSAVGRAMTQNVKSSTAEQPPKRKRRKNQEDLDDFVVSDDDVSLGCLEELSPLELGGSDRPTLSDHKQTVVRSYQSADSAKHEHGLTANAVVISGKHGCGKTAMVHAVASELGFEVFEINPGMRRSGRDVLERVGDMAGNHLVQHNDKLETAATSENETASQSLEGVEQDVASGKQGTMTSFFQKQARKQPTQVRKRQKGGVNHAVRTKAAESTKRVRTQKQSLILLEEVDVLFEEDRNFWTTVFSLIIGSKRPIVMTCTDELLVPLQAMTLHAILRLAPPAVDLVSDCLLHMAAREGHLLSRKALSALYRSKGHDLRASITELQFWCQMGVGDPRGGLDWIYQRWPPGTGVDKEGRPIRVISKDTYLRGMGCLSQARTDSQVDDEDRMNEAWDEWFVDPRDYLFEAAESKDLVTYGKSSSQTDNQLVALANLARLDHTLSDLDMLHSSGLPEPVKTGSKYTALQKRYRRRLDPTQPSMSDKARLDYIEGYSLLQTDEVADYTQLSKTIITSLTLRISDQHNLATHSRILDSPTRRDRATYAGPLSRVDFSTALDPVAESTPSLISLVYTSLDGPVRDITTDIAPYVRSIVRFDLALQEQRDRLSGALDSSSQGKRSRTTRAARSALEGGERRSTRRERWFAAELDLAAVLRTGGCDWA